MNKERISNDDFGDFEEIKVENEEEEEESEEETIRVRTPKKGEIIGIITQRFGGARMEVFCTDGKKRNCRVPGRFKRSLWLRPKDVVLIVPWPDNDEKGDIIFKYNPSAISKLRKMGMLEGIKEEF
ncbi:MAG: translation initiation factor eIF-1A [Candidatus Pacearchaeota archaeon]|nr:translation initiation factor eIF-1A [Candidatus Pacearchaeota archaeon]